MEGMGEEHPFLEGDTPDTWGPFCYIAQFPLQVAARSAGHPGDEKCGGKELQMKAIKS